MSISFARLIQRQRGATAVEFALLFPVFFLIFYAIITYGMIFAAQQSLTLAATEGARSALNYQAVSRSGSQLQQAALAARASAACTTATQLAGWLSGNAQCSTKTQSACGQDNAMYCVTVTLTYPYGTHPLIPTLPLLGLLLPGTLTSSATVQVDPVNII